MEKISTDKKEEWSLLFKAIFIVFIFFQIISFLTMILSIFEITANNFSDLFIAYTRLFPGIFLNSITLIGLKKTFKMEKEGYHLLVTTYPFYLIILMALTFSKNELFYFRSEQFIPLFKSVFNIDYIIQASLLLPLIIIVIYIGVATKSERSPF